MGGYYAREESGWDSSSEGNQHFVARLDGTEHEVGALSKQDAEEWDRFTAEQTCVQAVSSFRGRSMKPTAEEGKYISHLQRMYVAGRGKRGARLIKLGRLRSDTGCSRSDNISAFGAKVDFRR